MCLNKHDCLLNRLPWGAHAAFRLHMVLGWWTYLLRELRGLLSHLPPGGKGLKMCRMFTHVINCTVCYSIGSSSMEINVPLGTNCLARSWVL